MTDHRWTPSDSELSDALRKHYTAPSDPGYWSALEARILAHVARGAHVERWWSALVEMARPALAAAVILVLVAGAAVISAGPPSVTTAARASSVADGDATLDYMLSH
ncbi:MAG: hypothetical protein DMD35_10840 [Gemmatimonadetes bacterium]|nr:MAG: hypothetical protein DMD35_10840 [Gemmatimonadota bacterium]